MASVISFLFYISFPISWWFSVWNSLSTRTIFILGFFNFSISASVYSIVSIVNFIFLTSYLFLHFMIILSLVVMILCIGIFVFLFIDILVSLNTFCKFSLFFGFMIISEILILVLVLFTCFLVICAYVGPDVVCSLLFIFSKLFASSS